MDFSKIYLFVFAAVIYVTPSTAQDTPDVYAFATDQESSHRLRFNSWVYQQQQRLKTHSPTDIKDMPSQNLQPLVLKIFKEYNITLATGVIAGAKGEEIDSLNLELRSIFLGEKFFFQILDNNHTAIKLPKNGPFVEGILVAFELPPQVLGVISLAKTYLSPEAKVARRFKSSPQSFESAEDLQDLNLDVNQVNLNDVYTFETNDEGFQRFRFNSFFHKQIDTRFKKIRSPTDIKVISSHVLKALVLKVLNKYNMSLADGYIKDAKGEKMDPLNLELRPVLIGRKFFFQIFDNFQTVVKLYKGVEDVFLDSILVTLVSPPQVLGVIPLAKTYFN